MVNFKGFDSISQIKECAEFIRKGKTIPVRILKAENKDMQVYIKTGSNHYAIPTKRGYLVFVSNQDSCFDSVLRFNKINGKYEGSPYSTGGTHWEGNSDLDEETFLRNFNKKYLSMNT